MDTMLCICLLGGVDGWRDQVEKEIVSDKITGNQTCFCDIYFVHI